MSPKLRYAPSPTGYQHVGNIRTVLVNWLYAKKHGGHLLLRIDDTDTERSKPEFEAAIKEDLTWLGLSWDSMEHQSGRFDRYEQAKQKLIADGRLYACFETQEELDIKRKMQASRGLPPLYDRAALKLSEEEKQKLIAEGRTPHWRFMLNGEDVTWNDYIRGTVKFAAGHLSDPVLVRADGVPTYTLASVVDDGELGITEIIRGEDHVSNTAVQVQLFKALGFAVPNFGHLALLKTKDGELSKRLGGGDVRSLRAAGIEPMAICSLLAKIGTSDAVEVFENLQALADSFDITKFGRAPANYDVAELERLNARIVTHQPYATVKARLDALGLNGVDEQFWNSIRANLHTLEEAKMWWQLLREPLLPTITDKDLCDKAVELLPPEPWNESTAGAWTNAVKEATGKKGKELFLPLRLALTAREDGPELKTLLPLLGKAKAAARLSGQAA